MIARHPRGSGNESFRRRGAGLVQPESLNRGTRGRENGVLPGSESGGVYAELLIRGSREMCGGNYSDSVREGYSAEVT